MSKQPDWTREEHILAFKLYNEIPFGQIHQNNPAVQSLAKVIGRSVGSVSYKLANLARLDPVLQARGIKGMPHGAKGEEAVWAEFADHPEALAVEGERLLAARLGKTIEEVAGIETADLPHAGIERDAVVSVRVNQNFFRRRILSAFDFRCCVTGLTERALLTASHIVPWSADKDNRLNPRNGLCLNALHDRAFDRHLMWIDEDLRIRFAPRLSRQQSAKGNPPSFEWLTRFEGQLLLLPKKFSPSPEFLKIHAAKCAANAKD